MSSIKLNKSELRSLNWDEQKKWVDDATKDAFDDDPFCYIISLDEGKLKEWVEYPEDYNTGGEMKKVCTAINEARVSEINKGAKLSPQEKEYLKEAVLLKQSEDEFQGDNYMSRKITCTDGVLIAVFDGFSAGGFTEWSFYGVFNSQAECMENLKKNLKADERIYRM